MFFITSCGKDGRVIDDFISPSLAEKVSIDPQSATLGVGDSIIFTAAGDSIIRNDSHAAYYIWSFEPKANLELTQYFRNQVRVTLVSQPDTDSGYVKAAGPYSEATAVVYFKGG